MESVIITPLYAAALGIILLALSARVVGVVRAKVSLGDDGNPDFVTVIRGQGNFVEYVPLTLIVLGFAEAGGTSGTMIHAMGISLVVGRIMHPLGLKTEAGINPFRLIGTLLTWGVLLVASILIFVN